MEDVDVMEGVLVFGVGVAVRVPVAVRVEVGNTVLVGDEGSVAVEEPAGNGVSVGAGGQFGGGLDGITSPFTIDNNSASVMRGMPRKSTTMALANTPLASVPKCPSATRQL